VGGAFVSPGSFPKRLTNHGTQKKRLSVRESARHKSTEEVNRVKAAAIILIVVGIGIVIWAGFGFTTREKVLDVGPIHATKDEQHHVPYGALAGAVIALGGVVLLIKGKS
jgi:hypothetical protein